jgi:hypothetical protein
VDFTDGPTQFDTDAMEYHSEITMRLFIRRIFDLLFRAGGAGLHAPAKPGGANQLPVFDVPAGAERIPSDRARELLSNE